MTRTTFTAEVTENQATLLRRLLALSEELDDLALNAPDGTVLDACENAVLTGGRDLQRQLLQEAVARRVEAAEKKGRRCDSVPAVGPKRVVAFAMIATSKVFRRNWRSRLRQRGVVSRASVHALGDGASWIGKAVQRVLTGCVQTLDFFHACGQFGKATAEVFGEGTVAATQAFGRGRTLLLEQGWSGVCTWVSELLAVEPEEQQERRRRITDRTIRYFGKHLGRLNYAERLASGRAIGSGSVEGQAKRLGLRLKRRGARWRKANVRPMASLVCVRHSSQWDAYWKSLTH